MIRSIYFDNGEQSSHRKRQIDLSLEEIAQRVREPSTPHRLLWVSLEQPSSEELEEVLGRIFRFHPLAVEDCQSIGYQPPKVDLFEDYLFIITHALKVGQPAEDLETVELDCFLGKNYVVTSYRSPRMSPVQYVWERLARDERLRTHGADFLCHAILDRLVDEYMPVIDELDEELDQLEDVVLERPGPWALERILGIKHDMLTLRRIISPQREIMNRLSRDDLEQIQPQNRIYFRDIYDHLVRIYDLSESLRDVSGGTLDTYLSVTSNRLNEVMKTLTVVSTIFLPLTFLAGVYGMNFRHFPEISWWFGYPLFWLISITIAGIMLYIFRRNGWLVGFSEVRVTRQEAEPPTPPRTTEKLPPRS